MTKELINPPLPPFQALVSLLRLYASSRSISEAKALHIHIRNRGLHTNPILGALLVQIYGDCGSLHDAYDVFACIHPHSVFSWNVMIRAYTKKHEDIRDGPSSHMPLSSLQQMQQEGLQPTGVSFVSFLAVCLSSRDAGSIWEGKKAHVCIRESECRACVIVRNGLLNMYAKKGCVEELRREFDDMDNRNVVSWTSIMSAAQSCPNIEMSPYSFENNAMPSQLCMNNKTTTQPSPPACEATLGLFLQMQQEGILPDKVTFCTIIDACCTKETAHLIEGMRAHACIVGLALGSDVVLGTSILHMYGKCGNLGLANASFHDVPEKNIIIWTVAIESHARNERVEEAFQLFEQMKCEGILPNNVTVVSVLGAIGSAEGAISKGKQIHALVHESQFESDFLVDAAIINMYGRCRSIKDSLEVFHRLDGPQGVVVCSALVAVFVQNQEGVKALEYFTQMIQQGVRPNRVTLVSTFDACAKNVSLQDGRRIHVMALETQLHSNVSVGNALMDMYGKCGNLLEAKRVFAGMRTKDRVTWNTFVTTCARHGQGDVALSAFYEMVEQVKIDELSFLSIISSCSHAGLVDEGLQCFKLMYETHGIERVSKHYNSLIDLLGRAGRLDEAEGLTQSMPPKANLISLMTLLSACKQPGDICRGERITSRALHLNLDSSIANLMLSKVCFTSGNNQAVV